MLQPSIQSQVSNKGTIMCRVRTRDEREAEAEKYVKRTTDAHIAWTTTSGRKSASAVHTLKKGRILDYNRQQLVFIYFCSVVQISRDT